MVISLSSPVHCSKEKTILIAAHRGLLEWPLVVPVAIAGGTLGDQLAFLLGRWKGEALVERFPALAQRKPRIDDLLARFDVIFILTVRFLYGLRIAGPLILGSSRVPYFRFAVLNVIGATLWAMLVSGAGYAFGLAINSLIADAKRIEEIVLVVIPALGVALWLWHRFCTQTQKRAGMEGRL